MQTYGFDLRDPVLTLGTWQLSVQVITLENLYGLDPARLAVAETADGWHVMGEGLSWAGQQQRAPGRVEMRVRREAEHRLAIDLTAEAPHKIRAVKLLLRGLPPLAVLDMLDAAQPVPPEGVIKRYPNGLRLPVLFAQRPDGSLIGTRCADPEARGKQWAIFTEGGGPLKGTTTLELIHEADARHFDTQLTAPTWIIDGAADVDNFRQEQLVFNEAVLGVRPWEARADVPAWTRDINLCLTLHGMHWSGYVFNDYAAMLEIIRFVAERTDGARVLAYLPGWEGRYYWQYGDYRPEPLLGGAAGFAALCDGARELGVHVMPMFGATCANRWFPNFHEFGPSSHMKSATRNVFHGNQPDWDISRVHDTGWQTWLNPGAPAWQNELARQIGGLIDEYGFDSVFLDCAEVWVNDPDFSVREGLRQLVARLRQDRPDLLVTAEDWWDGTLGIFPITQHTGTWRQVPAWAGRYARFIGHICDGDPSRGSTGVHEAGYSPMVEYPHAAPYIPTLTFVDGTLAEAQTEIEAVIAAVNESA